MAFPHLLNQLFQSNGTSTKLKAEVLPDSYLSTKGGTVNGNITLTGTLTGKVVSASSDKRLKENITDYDADLSKLKAYSYNFKSDKSKHIGLIAQDVQSCIPEAVLTDSSGYLSIDPLAVIAILVNKVNELQLRVSLLEENNGK